MPLPPGRVESNAAAHSLIFAGPVKVRSFGLPDQLRDLLGATATSGSHFAGRVLSCKREETGGNGEKMER